MGASILGSLPISKQRSESSIAEICELKIYEERSSGIKKALSCLQSKFIAIIFSKKDIKEKIDSLTWRFPLREKNSLYFVSKK